MTTPAYTRALEALARAAAPGINPSLENISAVCAALGHPERCYRCAQVAGTNGKSSTSRYLASILRAHGLRVGLYTSPELLEVTERIEVDGRPPHPDNFAQALLTAEAQAGRLGFSLTEFELLTVTAFLLYAQSGLDWAVLEVGMGGRWDATSVVYPELAIITGIDFDHTAILGTSLEAIAAEKAAIIKPGSTAVIGPCAPTVLAVIQKQADVAGAPLIQVKPVSEQSLFAHDNPTPYDMAKSCQGCEQNLPTHDNLASQDVAAPRCPSSRPSSHTPVARNDPESHPVTLVAPPAPSSSLGRVPTYQIQNQRCAQVAAGVLLDKDYDSALSEQALAVTVVPGRFQILRQNPLLMIDAAHNPQALSVLLSALVDAGLLSRKDALVPGIPQPTLLLAVLADKDAHGVLMATLPYALNLAVTRSQSLRALPVDTLAALATEALGCAPRCFANSTLALDQLASEPQPLIATGSITLGAEVKRWYDQTIRLP
ncbi:MAG: hypothetical protein LBU07_02275 [Coriobacteriales bacterium]|jgi:dihydrofolate synthase/folylpolyglutamate synthase|nr:hypothetical protein [Coriobacteriales bacterium]